MKEFVILIDDEVKNTSTIAENIEFEDRKVESYNDPKDFIVFLEKNKSDFKNCKLLVVDYSMPELNGFDVFKYVFENIGDIDAKCILYSGNINQLKDSDRQYLLDNKVELLEKPSTETIIDYSISLVKESE